MNPHLYAKSRWILQSRRRLQLGKTAAVGCGHESTCPHMIHDAKRVRQSLMSTAFVGVLAVSMSESNLSSLLIILNVWHGQV